jgi:hypothetical protein
MNASAAVTTANTAPRATLLRTALLANALFAGINGIADVLFSGALAEFASLPAAIIPYSGAGLIAFAAALLWLRARPEMPQTIVRAVIAMDVLWVVGSVVLLLLRDSIGLTTAGAWSVAAGADVVALFAILQFVGLKRL